MRTFDLTPLYRSTVGFDRLASMLDNLARAEGGANAYPPYNIVKFDENSYRITIAAAGFSEGDLNVESHGGELIVTGGKSTEAKQSDADRTFLHRGIAERAFERRFQLADHVRVTKAELENGLLHVDLAREVPEALRPRRIEIARADKGRAALDAQPVNAETEAA